MGWQTLREAVPTVVMHMAAVAVHLMAAAGLGLSFTPLLTSLVATIVLVIPALALFAVLGGAARLGSLLFVLSFVATAGIVLYSQLGMGLLHEVLFAASSPFKALYFVSAALLPLLQIAGILEAARSLFAEREAQLADK